MAKRTLTVEIVGDPSSASRSFKRVGDDAKKMGDHLDRAGSRIHGFATVTTKGIGRVGIAAGGMAAAAVGASALLAKSFISSASDINESLTKNQVLFGKHADDIVKFADRSATAFGISRKAALEYTGTFGNLFSALGVAPKKSAEFSVSLTKLAGDMASFNNTSIEDALEAVRSGLVGETEPLRRFGVNLNDATLRQEAMSLGLTHTTKNVLTPYQKAMAAQALIVKQTEKAHGDFARTSGGFANQLRILKASTDNVGASIGKALLPAAKEGVKVIAGLMGQISKIANRKDLDLGEKITLSWEKIKHKLAPLGVKIKEAIVEFHIGQKLEDAFRAASPHIEKALKTIGALAARAFVKAFKDAGPWTKIATVAFLASKFGAFSAVGSWAAGKFTTSLKRRMGTTMPVAGAAAGAAYSESFAATSSAGVTASSKKGGKMSRSFLAAGGRLGTGMGIAAAGLFGVELAKGVEKTLSDKLPGGNKAHRPDGTPGTGWNLFDYIKGKVGDGAGRVVDRVKDAFPGQGLPQGGAFGGSLMGARPAMKPFAAIGSRFGLTVTSGRRPGAITSSGNPSWHGSGEAIDMSGSASGMLRFAKTLRKRYGGRLAELIHTPMGAGIKNGQPFTYGGQVAADHFDHVHVAFDSGRPGIGDGLGKFDSTSYGPPWGGINGTGVTATGIDLKGSPHRYGVAVDPSVIPLGTRLKISPNPFGYSGYFEAFDTGGGIKGKHIDFYDWRGHGKQNAWGHKKVTISTAAGGAHGGGPGSGPKKGALYLGPRTGTVGPTTGGLGPGMTASSEQSGADFGLAESTARAQDNLGGLIAALTNELRLKQRRAKHIRKYLKRRRVSRANRQKFTEELTQLVTDIAELKATLKEYKADAKGGATTVSGAEKLDAGVDSSAEAPATPADFANLAIAEAALTPGLDDDKAALGTLLGIRQGELNAARATGDPRKILDALNALTEVTTALNSLTDAMTGASQVAQDLADVKVLLQAIKDAATTATGVGYREALKFMADSISGQVVGTNLQGRRQTAGNGRVAITP